MSAERVFVEGARAGLPVGATFFLAFLGVGAVFEVAGLSWAQAGLSTLLLMSGPAQAALVQGLQSGQSLVALMLAVTVINGRYFVLSAVLAPAFRRTSLARLFLPLTFLSTTTFAVTHAALRRPGAAAHPLAFFCGVSLASVPPAIAGTIVGYHAAGTFPEALRATVDMILPIYFMTLLAREWPRVGPLGAAGLGFALTPVLERLAPGLGMLLASVAAGLIVGLAPRRN